MDHLLSPFIRALVPSASTEGASRGLIRPKPHSFAVPHRVFPGRGPGLAVEPTRPAAAGPVGWLRWDVRTMGYMTGLVSSAASAGSGSRQRPAMLASRPAERCRLGPRRVLRGRRTHYQRAGHRAVSDIPSGGTGARLGPHPSVRKILRADGEGPRPDGMCRARTIMGPGPPRRQCCLGSDRWRGRTGRRR